MFNWLESGLNWLFHKYFYFWYNLQESGVNLPGKELKEFRIDAYSQQMAEGATATLTMSIVPIFFTAIIGIPLGVFLASADQKGKSLYF